MVPLLTRFAARNRTRRAVGSRELVEGLMEFDTYATNAKSKEEVAADRHPWNARDVQRLILPYPRKAEVGALLAGSRDTGQAVHRDAYRRIGISLGG